MNLQSLIHAFHYCFAVNTNSNNNHFKLETASPIQKETITGIRIRRRTAGSKSINNNDLVNDNVLKSSFLTLKQRNAEVFEKIPLEVIALATDNGLWYELCMPGIDMAQSEIYCSNTGAIVNGEDYEFVFRYQNNVK